MSGRPTAARVPIPAAPAIGTWSISWVVGAALVAPLLVVDVGGTVGGDLTIAQLAVATVGAWSVFGVALVLASRRFGSGSVGADLGWSFRPVDLVGIPIGVATQLVVVPLLYLALRELWPDTFDPARIEERARDLADRRNVNEADQGDRSDDGAHIDKNAEAGDGR